MNGNGFLDEEKKEMAEESGEGSNDGGRRREGSVKGWKEVMMEREGGKEVRKNGRK